MSSSTSSAPAASAPSRFSRRPVERSSIDRHRVAAGEQGVDEVRADEARAACDQSPHSAADPRARASFPKPEVRLSAAHNPCGVVERPCYSRPPMRLIVTEKNNSAKKIAEILGAASGGPTADKTFKVPFYTWTRRRRRAPHDRPQGPRARPGLPRGLLELAEDGPPRPDRRRADQGADRQKRRQSDQESRQRSRRARDRHRLRPRGRADRARGARRDARRQSRARLPRGQRKRDADDSPRPLLGADQGGDRARLRRPRHALLPARQRRRRPPGHRPALGRDPDPRGLALDPALRLQLPLRRPRPEPDPRPDRRARDGAPRPRRQTVLGTVRQVPAPRRQLRGPSQRRQILGESEADAAFAGTVRPGQGDRGHRPQEHAQTADSLQHDRLQHRRLQPPRNHPGQRHADRRGPLHGRLHLLPAHRQHGLPDVAADP